MRSFRSDNNAGLCPEALAGLTTACDGAHHIGYGDDVITQRAVEVFHRLFGESTAVFFVATGTAANTLAIASLTEPWNRVLCHRHSHYNDDESTAPERLTGCRVTALESDPVKIVADDLRRLIGNGRGDVHQPSPGVLTLSNATEFGTVYRPAELRELCDLAHEGGYRVHMDGARFANAVAACGCAPRELTVDVGLDALSFGGTKNGLAFGEAVLFFRQGDGSAWRRARETFEHHRKASGHLLSKHRFVSAPFAATLDDGSWLRHAAHANAMARRLATGLHELGIEPVYPVEANGVFVRLPVPVDEALQARGHGYYPFGDSDQGLSRLMCSFDTTEDEVDGFLADVRGAQAGVV